jgi:hypothetical protein
MAPNPIVKIAPPAPKTGTSQRAVFDAYVNKHPALKQWAQGIYRNALNYGIDPLYFASLINTESKGNPNEVSSAGAIGLGQIMPLHVGEAVPWAPGTTVTLQDLKTPAFNLRYSAYYFGQKLSAAGGNYDQAYRGQGGYNQGGPQIFQDVPKTYVPTTTAKSPTDTAVASVESATAKRALTDPWVVVQGGKLKFVNSDAPPQGTIKQYGIPVTRSTFLSQYQSISDDYLAWTGKRPSYTQAAHLIATGKSQFQLRQDLAQTPGFVNSPVWKQNAPGYVAVWHSVYGQNSTPDQAAIRNAVANNLGSGAFQDVLRQRPDYNTSNEYKAAYAANENVYRQIYGQPSPADAPTIDMAVKNGYDANTFAAYLRKQPQWKSSAEAQQLYYGLANRLGLIQGNQTVLNGPSPQT